MAFRWGCTMDEAKLAALRRRYTGTGAFDAEDPQLKRAGEVLAAGSGQRGLPYSGVATFMGLPQATSLAGLDVAVIGVPMDLGVSNRPGARFGPRGVRSIERIGPYHPTFPTGPKGPGRAG